MIEGDVYKVTTTRACMHDERPARIGITGFGLLCIACAEKLAAKLEKETK